ncbi:MAG: hypothetical protein K1X75_11730 [Leptospirales bacterium]|nr:hypothetical protein [Leptospirales bacterium]
MHNLRELKGQPLASALLGSYVERLPPPLLLLYGPDGVGKFSAAEAFVQQSLCETGQGCGQCAPCAKIRARSHADVIVFPEAPTPIGEPGNSEEFTVRWLQEKRLRYSPFDGRLRFVLFPRADLIQNEAETALLKTLEEPPAHTRFLFVARDLEALKPTVVSRAVLVPFRRLSQEVLRQLAPGLSDEQFDLLGGSLAMAPLLVTAFYSELRGLLQRAFQHPLALLDLERRIQHWERSGVSEAEQQFSGAECVGLAATLMLYELQQTAGRLAASAAVFRFLERWNREQSGESAYILGRLFQELSLALFQPDAANLKR